MYNDMVKYLSENNILNVGISDEKKEKLYKFYEILVEKNKVMNLTSITEIKEFTYKHYIDSIALEKVNKDLDKKPYSIADLGTGAGFPGIPLAIVFPNLNMTLIDSLNKRIKFIQEACDILEIKNVNAIHSRAEDIARNKAFRESFDICVSRAVANLASLSEYCLPLVKIGGSFISYKSKGYDIELKEAQKAIKVLGGEIESSVKFDLGEYGERILLDIRKVKPTSNKYPRKAGLPTKEPIK
ncbi:16S rRNA (guanine(527)-N(7))-methyltransferase RsmG [Lachnoanaerobaculum umeaense]|uniref:Ribosomal RNA small subunit methyltransferase G n=1 Tax=Lachnoanaerobaculum umeaense TaxID=617123 RepID=A0A385PWZ8_9FIRM|nr:16S rRNA (guanine(527)-N(7))-methyltransferase RsmG [Lachnoanaerobaculum umeaense]AYA98506.1 16S rRNA (guanine(527)-N(7))-methyltransferase RsmG [Lachnoanaerobaculum umeaense]PZW93551.1 16S rRNA (guanine527-N7)-methyltransferase [Lachnoanaerobaculum umeaense]